MGDRQVVRAAGCVVWRRGVDGTEVLLVHRPLPHDDWSLPKGKLDRGESHRDAAVREVREETGATGALGPKLLEVRYPLDGGEKRVRWWAMELGSDEGFVPNEEIDDRRWRSVPDVLAEVTWDSDRRVLRAFSEASPDSGQ